MNTWANCDNCKHNHQAVFCKNCLATKPPSNWEAGKNYIPPSNADHIRAMSDEELAKWINEGISSDPCDYCEFNMECCDGSPCRGKSDAETIIEWLRQPVK